jgi:hypothetical protein
VVGLYVQGLAAGHGAAALGWAEVSDNRDVFRIGVGVVVGGEPADPLSAVDAGVEELTDAVGGDLAVEVGPAFVGAEGELLSIASRAGDLLGAAG